MQDIRNVYGGDEDKYLGVKMVLRWSCGPFLGDLRPGEAVARAVAQAVANAFASATNNCAAALSAASAEAFEESIAVAAADASAEACSTEQQGHCEEALRTFIPLPPF
eukprot:1161218-Pelagomonas_calceolata.AAC.1